MSRRHPSTFKPLIDANLTSMSDLTFLLLITFIITFPMIENGISVKLHKGESRRVDPQQQMGVVTVDREGRLYLGSAGSPVTIEQLEAELERRRSESPDMKLAIHGDVDVHYGRVMDVVRLAKLGFEAPILSTSGKE